MPKNDILPLALRDLALALVLLTRLPLPRLPEAAFARQAQAGWAFPLAGLAVAVEPLTHSLPLPQSASEAHQAP